MLRHGGVDFARQFDETRMLSVLACLPSQIEGVDRYTVPTESGPGIEWHVAEGFRLRGVDDFPDIDPHGAVNEFQLVHQGDVDAPKDVFQELGRLGGPAGGDGNQSFDRPAVDLGRPLQTGRGVAADHFRDAGDVAVGIAGIFPLRRKCEVEVHSSAKPRAFLQNAAEIFVCGAGVGGAFQNNEF